MSGVPPFELLLGLSGVVPRGGKCVSFRTNLRVPHPSRFLATGGITRSSIRTLRLPPFAKNAKDGAPGGSEFAGAMFARTVTAGSFSKPGSPQAVNLYPRCAKYWSAAFCVSISVCCFCS